MMRNLLPAAGVLFLLAASTSCIRTGATEASHVVADAPTVAVVKVARADLSTGLVLTA
jgi:hypothetical protein